MAPSVSDIVNCFIITISPLQNGTVVYCVMTMVFLSYLPLITIFIKQKIPSKRPQTWCTQLSELPARDELTAGRSADGLDVVVLQLHALRCQLVQGRGVDVSVVVADVVEALIVRHDEDNVRTRMVRRLDLVRTRPVLGQIAQTEQTHHGERRQSRCCHGNAFNRL